MKLFAAILLVICTLSSAYAEITLPVSCENVTKISIDQLKASEIRITLEGDPYLYFITLWLTPATATKYNKLAAPSIITAINPDGSYVITNPILLQTSSGSIYSDAPYQTSINSRQLILLKSTKEKAFKAARRICPQINPKAFFVYDYLEEQRLKKEQD